MTGATWYLIACLVSLFSMNLHAAVSTVRSDAQTALEVTVYNNNLGLVRDVREIQLPEGDGELRFMDVASGIQPASVLIQAEGDPESFVVREQNYEYDLMSPEKLLDKYVGKEITIIDFNEYQDRTDAKKARLLSTNGGQVLKIGDLIHLGYPGYRAVAELPDNLIAKPTLMWLYRNTSAKPRRLAVTYLTENISWRADYVLALDKNDAEADLAGWITIDNRSGGEYANARLKLIAGDVERERPPMRLKKRGYMAEMAQGVAEQTFFEYHLYDFQRTTTIKNNQTKQIRLLGAAGIALKKEYVVRGEAGFFHGRRRSQEQQQPVEVHLSFVNTKRNSLGMPLPMGVVRVYKADLSGSRQFIGEDRIDHTPEKERVELQVGAAFDIVAERTQTHFEQLSSKLSESAWEITLRNHKDAPVTIAVIEPFAGNWDIVKTSHDYTKTDAFTVRFNVAVPKNGEKKLIYRVRTGM